MKGSSIETPSSLFEPFRRVFMAFPCSDKVIVDRMFNDFYAIQSANHFGQLETEEAEVRIRKKINTVII